VRGHDCFHTEHRVLSDTRSLPRSRHREARTPPREAESRDSGARTTSVLPIFHSQIRTGKSALCRGNPTSPAQAPPRPPNLAGNSPDAAPPPPDKMTDQLAVILPAQSGRLARRFRAARLPAPIPPEPQPRRRWRRSSVAVRVSPTKCSRCTRAVFSWGDYSAHFGKIMERRRLVWNTIFVAIVLGLIVNLAAAAFWDARALPK
jgi:hypothetical protein